jgi:hypothetical protein
LLFEVSAQLESFDLESFRRLYHQRDLFSKANQRFTAAPLDLCTDQGVDDFSYHPHHTPQTSSLRIVFFGRPKDRLLSADGNLTHTAKQTIRRVASYRERFRAQWLQGSPPLGPHLYLLTRVDFDIVIGRRSLGAERFDAFNRKLETDRSIRGIQLAGKRSRTRLPEWEFGRRQMPIKPDRLNDGDVPSVRSFDQILDEARFVALEPYPFPDQDLLRGIIEGTTNPDLLAMALDRLDPVPANSGIFAAHLRSKVSNVRHRAILGATDVSGLRQLLSIETDIDKDLVRARIAMLEEDEEALCDIAMNAFWFDAEYAAIEALNDKKKLERIFEHHQGESTPKAGIVRALVAAREAFIDRDVEALEALQKDARFEVSHAIIRMKSALASRAKVPPRVFISYKRESQAHTEWVMMLGADLRKRGINALLDEWEVDLGDSLSDYMALAIGESDVMLFIITEGAVAAVEGRVGGGIKFEFQIANARRYQGADFRIVGVLRSGDRPPGHIADNLYIDFRNDGNYLNALQRLVDSLLGRRKIPPIQPAYD